MNSELLMLYLCSIYATFMLQRICNPLVNFLPTDCKSVGADLLEQIFWIGSFATNPLEQTCWSGELEAEYGFFEDFGNCRMRKDDLFHFFKCHLHLDSHAGAVNHLA